MSDNGDAHPFKYFIISDVDHFNIMETRPEDGAGIDEVDRFIYKYHRAMRTAYKCPQCKELVIFARDRNAVEEVYTWVDK
ncbi:MAG: hypothetical protein ACAI35_25790 [Candidatus Methylacidiphilales bacterium]|nr:hypothetical protein [Candidatus Methylacidiphilales bacterium]